MEAVSHHVEDVSENLHVITSIEGVGNLAVFIDVQQNFLKKIEAQVAVGAELVSERPDNAI